MTLYYAQCKFHLKICIPQLYEAEDALDLEQILDTKGVGNQKPEFEKGQTILSPNEQKKRQTFVEKTLNTKH